MCLGQLRRYRARYGKIGRVYKRNLEPSKGDKAR